jgi:4-aminobutyrate aminotransferase-like enzyme
MKFKLDSEELVKCSPLIGWTTALSSQISSLWPRGLPMASRSQQLPPDLRSLPHSLQVTASVTLWCSFLHLFAGSMGGTYGGNSVSCAAALAVLDVLQEEMILDNVKKSEKIVRGSLNQLQDPDLVKEVRGKGLMIGIEFNRPSSAPPGWVAKEVSARCAERGLIVLACGPYDTVRLIPPLNVSESELKEGMAIVDEAITFVSDEIKAG